MSSLLFAFGVIDVGFSLWKPAATYFNPLLLCKTWKWLMKMSSARHLKLIMAEIIAPQICTIMHLHIKSVSPELQILIKFLTNRNLLFNYVPSSLPSGLNEFFQLQLGKHTQVSVREWSVELNNLTYIHSPYWNIKIMLYVPFLILMPEKVLFTKYTI